MLAQARAGGHGGAGAAWARLVGHDPVWEALLCDSHAVLEVLVRFGREHDPQVRAGLERMAADITGTAVPPPGLAARVAS